MPGFTMRRFLFSIITAIMVVAVAMPLFAQVPRVVRVGAFNYYPAIFRDHDGTVKGFYVDALDDIARRENIRFQFVYGSWSEGLERIRTGEVDLLTSVAYTPERSLYLDFGKMPLLTVWGELYTSTKSDMDSITEVGGKRIAVMKGDINAARFMDLVKKFNITCRYVEFPAFDAIFAAIAEGKVDAGVVNSTFGAAKQREYGLRSTGVVFNPFDIYFATARGKNGDLLKLLDRYLVNWRHQEVSVFNMARQKWSHGTAGVMRVMPRWVSAAMISLAVAAVVATLFVILLRAQVRRRTVELAAQIAEREAAEEEKRTLADRLNQLQKLESVGRLAGGIAHDFNNLLTPILVYAELMKMSLPTGSQDVKKMDSIIKAAEKARKLTQQLLSYGRKQVLELKTIGINEVVTSFYDILRRTIPESIDIRLHLAPDVFGVRADRHQLEQILMNLVVNAGDAIEDNGIITIETAPVMLDQDYARQHPGVNAGPHIMLAVTDNGCGMDKETLSQIFEPFYTTKGRGGGSGLGLATVYGLVQQHGGTIWVYSEPGQGTVFKVYFPMGEAPTVEAGGSRSGRDMALQRGGTILLVEDNPMVREMTHELLAGFGFKVVVAEGPTQALAAISGCKPDLLLTDVIMPDMTGPELHGRLVETYPELRVLYMSGYTDNVIARHGVLEEGINFIQKPFTVHDLIEKIGTVLNRP